MKDHRQLLIRKNKPNGHAVSQKILICDDTPTVLDFLELVFEKQGFEVIRAGNGAYALEMASEHHPDVLLVDAMMPGIDGFEVCRKLRANPDTAGETILMYSAIVGEEVRARALSAGADEFLGKMLSHAELVDQVRDWLAARSAPGGVGQPEWVQLGLDLLVLFRSELVWLLEAGQGSVTTLSAVSERGEQQALRFVQKLGAGPLEGTPGSFLGGILAQSELTAGRTAGGDSLDPDAGRIFAALRAVEVNEFKASRLQGRQGRKGLVLFACPTTLTLDRQGAEEIAIALRYAEAVLGRQC
jgi:DNA-binding response OmpR family regulator